MMIDNVDSFTFTIVDYLRQLGAEVAVRRSTEIGVDEALHAADAIVIGPGPGRPEQGGISIPLAAACIAARKSLLGVCLGHQSIALAAGGRVGQATAMHGRTDRITHDGSGLFANLPSPVTMTRYHSLVATDLPDALAANAWGGDGTVQGMRHRAAPVHGVQFHPESVASEHGLALLAAFLADAAQAIGGKGAERA